MKISELITSPVSEEVKGKWKIGNLNGVYKNFKSEDSPEARAWMKNRAGRFDPVAWNKTTNTWDPDTREADREAAKKQKDESNLQKAEAKRLDKLYKELYDRGIEAIGSSFPDGDPIDHISAFMRKNKLYGDDLDAAFAKYGDGYEKKGFYATVAGWWDDMQPDQMHDANIDLKAGRQPEHSDFYDIKDGKVVAKQNPWK